MQVTMQSFINHSGLIAVLNRGNIDTDQIISKEHLKSIKRTGFGPHLFSDWRYLDDGKLNPKFELNQAQFQGASILITGNNFGCGSSREHAVWSIVQYGFRVVIAPRKKNGDRVIPAFADIFYSNSSKNALLLVELSETEINDIIAKVNNNEGLQAEVLLSDQKVILKLPTGDKQYPFAIDKEIKHHLMEGLDPIGETERFEKQITAFEKKHDCQI